MASTFAIKENEGDEGQGKALVIVSMRNKPSEMLLSHVLEKLCRDPQPRDSQSLSVPAGWDRAYP